MYEKHNYSKEKADFIQECDTIANLMNTYMIKLRKNKVHLLQEKTFEMYKMLSSKSGLIKDLEINDKTYEIIIRDKSGHEMKKSGLSAGEKEVFALSLLWGLAQTSQLNLPIISIGDPFKLTKLFSWQKKLPPTARVSLRAQHEQ